MKKKIIAITLAVSAMMSTICISLRTAISVPIYLKSIRG